MCFCKSGRSDQSIDHRAGRVPTRYFGDRTLERGEWSLFRRECELDQAEHFKRILPGLAMSRSESRERGIESLKQSLPELDTLPLERLRRTAMNKIPPGFTNAQTWQPYRPVPRSDEHRCKGQTVRLPEERSHRPP